MEADKGSVCVTGGTGFIASWLIKRLLEEVYAIRTTVRADSVGIKGVFYVATPLDFENKETEEILTERAISGTLGILKDLDIMDESFWSDVGFVRCKTTPNFGFYITSKTFTERVALEFGAQHGLHVVTVIPSLVVGPFICSKFPGSVRSSLALILATDNALQEQQA
ncbi:Detected protein of unknown function [Hibiscus syriacus]|uniref:Uncharacterized protein n=1 Tax=Hibiscus syriacus TaxID=106335 RepID=A0A6A2WL18_HIBSY|nr:Detected protein of unknown function [Hibiscus syriacus]